MIQYAILSLALIVVPAASSVSAAETAVKEAAPADAKPKTKSPSKPHKKPAPKGPAELNTKQQKVGYAVGYNAAYGLKRNLEAQTIPVDVNAVTRGFADAMANEKSEIPEQEIRTILGDLQKDLDAKVKENMAKEQEKQRMQGEMNKKQGEAFLKENSAKEGVKVLPSGLQYRILAEGTGKKPAATDTVTVNYRGTLINGTEFDSSFKRGQQASFPLNQVIKGWTEGIQLIKEGGKIQLFIPSELAYGDRSTGQIGPHSTLIFDVDLISVQSSAGSAASGPTTTAR